MNSRNELCRSGASKPNRHLTVHCGQGEHSTSSNFRISGVDGPLAAVEMLPLDLAAGWFAFRFLPAVFMVATGFVLRGVTIEQMHMPGPILVNTRGRYSLEKYQRGIREGPFKRKGPARTQPPQGQTTLSFTSTLPRVALE